VLYVQGAFRRSKPLVMALFASLLWSHFQKNFCSYREHTYSRRSGLWFSILIGSFLWQAGFCAVLWNQRAFLGWNRPWMRFEIWCSLMSFFWCIWDLAFVDAMAGFHAARERGYRGYYIYIRRHSWLYPWSNHWGTSPKGTPQVQYDSTIPDLHITDHRDCGHTTKP